MIRDAIAVFGVDRCMFASNFPVDGIVGSFETIYSGFLDAVADRRRASGASCSTTTRCGFIASSSSFAANPVELRR